MMEETPQSSNEKRIPASNKDNDLLTKLKDAVERLTPLVAVVTSLYMSAKWFLKWLKNPQISPAALLTSLIIVILALSWYIYQHRKRDERRSIVIWIVIFLFLSAIASLGATIGFVQGREVESAELASTSKPALAADNSTYNFEQGLQGWEMGVSRTGRQLGTNLERTLEQAFAGSYALKFEQNFEVEAPTIGIGRVKSLPQRSGNELVIAYVKIPVDAPANVGVTFFTYCADSSQYTDVYTDDLGSEKILRPGYWNTLVWEVRNDNSTSEIGIGLKFRLVPKEEVEWVRGSEYIWERGTIYVDAVQVVRRSLTGQLAAVEPPSESSTHSTPTATPSPETPTETSTPVALAKTPVPSSTPVLTAVITAEALNLRVGPGIEYEIIRTLMREETLALLGITSNSYWLHVRTSKQEEGWVHASYVDSDRNLDVVPTVTATPPRTWLDAPTPLQPLTEERASCVNQVELKWRWIRPLANSEYFSVRVSRQGTEETEEACFHDKTQNTVYSGPLPSCNAGTLCWETVAVRLFSIDPEIWIELSPPSEPQCFDFAQETPAPPTDVPAPPGDDDDDDDEEGGGGGGPICPPPC